MHTSQHSIEDGLAGIVTIVSGLPRSGTSLMMQMLGAAGLDLLTDGRREADEDNPQGYVEYEPVRASARDTSWIDDATGRVVKVIHLLVPHLPTDRPYRVLMMRRDLDEVLASQQRMLERSGQSGARLSADTLRQAFERQLEEVRQHLFAHDCFRMLDVDYSELVTTGRDYVSTIAEWLELPPASVDRMTAVIQPELYRNRRDAPNSR